MEVIGDGIRLDLEQILEFEHDKQSNSFKCSIPREKLNGEVKISFQRYVGLEKVIQVDCDKTKGKAVKEYADGIWSEILNLSIHLSILKMLYLKSSYSLPASQFAG